jgi:GNAT superfamily N-acetyltransferase
MKGQITPFNSRLLDQLNQLPPEDWNANAYELFMLYEWQPWFKPFQLIDGNKLIAFGMIWHFGDTAWLGWILVDKGHRKKGLGTAITRFLIDTAKSAGAEKIILTATAMGMPIYQKLGFETAHQYRFFKNEKPLKYRYEYDKMRKMTKADLDVVHQIDRAATGEERRPLLDYFIGDTLVQANAENQIEGFYIEKLGTGFVAAKNPEAGLNLLRYHMRHSTVVALPGENEAAASLLLAKGYTETHRIPRMVLGGNEAPWQPAMIYSRGAGYCG